MSCTEITRVRSEHATGRYVAPAGQTLDDYLGDWLAAVCRGVEPGTARTYQDALRVPRELLGRRKLQSLTTTDITGIVEHMLTQGRKKGGPAGSGLSLPFNLRVCAVP